MENSTSVLHALKVAGWALTLALGAILIDGREALASPDLEQCSVIVTGTDLRSRDPGLSSCFMQALVKLAGDPTIPSDPRAAEVAARAPAMVEDFAYFDRMSDVPMHDEQGSRDRPFDLVAHFDPAKLDQALASLGRKPWRGARPALVVGVAVKDQRGGEFILSADGNAGERQRESLFAAGKLYGLRVVLLTDAALPRDVTAPQLLTKLGDSIPSTAVVPLTGTLRWSDADFGWVGAWTLTQGNKVAAWEVRGVSFDEAFRNAVGGASALLSRHDSSP
jgi:hypothetical protein